MRVVGLRTGSGAHTGAGARTGAEARTGAARIGCRIGMTAPGR